MISKLRHCCERLRCECLEAVSTVKTVCPAAHCILLCFSHQLLPHGTWKPPLTCPALRLSNASLFVLLCLHLLFLKSFMLEPFFSISPSQRRKHFLPKKPAPFLYPFMRLSLSVSLCLHLAVSLIAYVCSNCGAGGQRERCTAMWQSSPQGTVQVSRLGWRRQAQSVTNASGWSAAPSGTLFHSSVGTWQQSPQEPFKWDKLHPSQRMLLHAHPSPLDHTFKTRWSCFSLCLNLLFLCFLAHWLAGELAASENKKKNEREV